MTSMFKRIATILMLASLFTVPLMASVSVNAQSASEAVCESLGATGNECGEGGSDIDKILGTVLNIISFIAGVIAVIMIIIAGIKFVTSQGDAGSVSSARQTVIYAIVGIVIVLVSQVIVRFVLTEAADISAPDEDETRLIIEKVA